VESKAECVQLNLAHVYSQKKNKKDETKTKKRQCAQHRLFAIFTWE